PTIEPTVEPTIEPTEEPTEEPTIEPTVEPTVEPTIEPTEEPTVEPTAEPTVEPFEEPTVEPTNETTVEEFEVESTTEPTVEPTAESTETPEVEPTTEPAETVSAEETIEPVETIEGEDSTPEPSAEPAETPAPEATEELDSTPEPTEELLEERTEIPAETPATEIVIDMSGDIALPLSLREAMGESAAEIDWNESIEIEYDEALISIETIEGDILVMPLESFEETTIVLSTNCEIALQLCSWVQPIPALVLDMAVIAPIHEEETLPGNAEGHAELIEGARAEDAYARIAAYLSESKPAESLPMRSKGKLNVREGAALNSVDEATESAKAPLNSAAQAQYRVFDIALNNVDSEQFDGFTVSVTLPEPIVGRDFKLYHLHGEDEIEELSVSMHSEWLGNGMEKATGFSFETDNFSLFVLSYTVDFEYEDAKYTLPGSGYLSLKALVKALQLAQDDPQTEADELQEFMNAIESVHFSNSELVYVTYVTDSTTLGALKTALELDCEYSAELTPIDIANLNAQQIEAGDWAIISLKPFTTEETLTIAMINGETYEIRVTDGQIERRYMDESGDTYRVTVVYSDEAGIPDGAALAVKALSDEEYEDYLARTAVFMNAAGFEYARIFDISIVDEDGAEIEPLAPVQVSVALLDAENTDDSFAVVHFTGDDEETREQLKAESQGNTVWFSADSFSAYAIVQGPSVVPLGWHKISSVAELLELGSSGLYIGHIDGYYLTSDITAITADRTGITKTKPADVVPTDKAVLYFFEAVDGTQDQFVIYCLDGEEKKYVVQQQTDNSLNFTTGDEFEAQVFTVEPFPNTANTFRIKGKNGFYWNMQGGASGASFAAYNAANDGNAKLCFWQYLNIDTDPYGLAGKSYGLMNWYGGVSGRAMMSTASNANALDALPCTVMSKANDGDKLFVPNDTDISMWTFHWDSGDKYYISSVVNGNTRYLKIDSSGLTMVDDQSKASQIQVVPGTGTHAGEICLKSGKSTLTFSGETADGFNVDGSAGSEWLKLVDISELTSDYFMTYTASKVSVSDETILNGSRIIVYTRSWNDEKKQYEFYAVNYDGSLTPCYESGDSIQWVGGHLNTMLWNFVEYTDNDGNPNYYYELYNMYSEKFIAPQLSDGQILSGDTIGLQLNGRKNGQYYSPILAWDDVNYAYAGLKVEDRKIVVCPRSEAMDFYFAVVNDIPVDDTLSTVKTVDHTQYGITMKIVDFTSNSDQNKFLDSSVGGAVKTTVDGLLSTNLGTDGYPTNGNGVSLGELYSGADEVNHLFIESTYYASGYYEYDSTANFASLDLNSKNFTVYNELGTMDGDNKSSLKHGQFMPFNDLEAGVFASVNAKNLYNATLSQLGNSDPRKYEQMYLVQKPNYYFGVELEASFTQTPNGLDNWGHDIIYEFTGDDDFWLYVDGELIIDLGGIHSALAGSVNYSTGDVEVNGTKTTLRALFEKNYRGRNEGATDDEVNTYLAQYFDDGSTIFKDYTTHTMRIFYMERGAGASNLHMRFNLASVKPGTVKLNKKLTGVDDSEDILAEFPYQIKYKTEGNDEEILLKQGEDLNETVTYENSTTAVKFKDSLIIDGVEYKNVFILKSGETVDIQFPENTVSYSIVECGVNTEVYDQVSVNGSPISGTKVGNTSNREDYATDFASTNERAQVNFENHVKSDALRT
ncbi:MAG: hypothetical protein IJ234_09510, partial [Clostridia bacterium]|nr:hypothetical protein [Clostridia bacterium]